MRRFLRSAACGLCGATLLGFSVSPAVGQGASPAPAANAKRPNIVFIISDDQRWDCIGAAGNPNVVTPNIDRFAKEGIHFTQATMNIPQCSPGRAQNLTGLPPHQNGWYSNQSQRVDVRKKDGFNQYKLMPDLLRKSGYRTALVGKWHLMPEPWNCGFSDVGTWMPGGGGPYKNPPLAHGKSRQTTATQGFTQDLFTSSAVEFLKDAARGNQPFFLWLAYTAPHMPVQPNPPEVERIYAGKTNDQLKPPGFVGTADKRKANQWEPYYEAITMLDNQVGRIRATLQETKLDQNTIVVFLGDNGFMMGSRGWTGKVVPYDESIRVPLIVWGAKGMKEAGQTTACASSLDLPPTFLRFAGVPAPVEWAGRDLKPVLEGKPDHGIDYSVSEFPDNDNWKFGKIAYRTVRTNRFKLIQWNPGGKPPELYDLVNDPHEQKNLAEDPTAKPERERLEGLLKAWMEKTNDHWTLSGEKAETREAE